MKKEKIPYRQMIFVCTNARNPGERISCAGEGRCGLMVLEHLKSYIKKNKLEALARAAKSGCQEKCEVGPNIAVLPQNDFLSAVTPDDVDRIIADYLSPLVP
jgi:(2Fe-2S) ferredoxin